MRKILFIGTMLVLLASFHIGKIVSKKLTTSSVYPGEVVAILEGKRKEELDNERNKKLPLYDTYRKRCRNALITRNSFNIS